MKQVTLKIWLAVICLSAHIYIYGQSPVTLEQCEDLFRKNNLLLIVASYGIDAAKAGVIQARIWEHPYLSGEINLVNPENKRVFDAGGNGEKVLAVEQLIALGSKKKEVNLAKGNVALAELQFEDLLRNLRFQVRDNFYRLYFDLLKLNTTSAQLANVDSLAKAYAIQAEKGNVPLKDLVRLQALSLSLKSELLELQKNINTNQETIKILTGTGADITPVINKDAIGSRYNKITAYTTQQLYDMALAKNTDYLLARKVSENAELMIKWQKALAVPDVNLGLAYDQMGGAFRNQVNLTLGIPLVLWNRNKGNIKMAQAQLQQAKTLGEQKGIELKAGIDAAIGNLLYQQKHYADISEGTSQNMEQVYNGVLQNFHRRNISLIEFTDFMESYNQSVLLINEMKKQIILSEEELNLLVNESLF